MRTNWRKVDSLILVILVIILSIVSFYLGITLKNLNKVNVLQKLEIKQVIERVNYIKDEYQFLYTFNLDDVGGVITCENDTISKEEIFRSNQTVAIFIPNITCTDCIRSYIDVVKKSTHKYKYKVIVLATFADPGYFSKICRVNVFGTDLYRIQKSNCLSAIQLPFICYVKDYRAEKFFVPSGEIEVQIERYFNEIERYLQ